MSVATPEWSPPLEGTNETYGEQRVRSMSQKNGKEQTTGLHPFADTTNRPSVFFVPPTPASADSSNTRNDEAQKVTVWGIGMGAPFEREDRRDITVKPLRRPAPAPPSGVANAQNPRPTHRSTKSFSSLPYTLSSSTSSGSLPSPANHAPIPAPVYPVTSSARTFTSAPMQLSRSQSLRSSLSASTSSSHSTSSIPFVSQPPLSPTISGGLARRLSVSSLSSASTDEEDEDDPLPWQRPLARRSESLPSFPPLEVLEAREREEKDRQREESGKRRERELQGLPPNPKLWLPSHLSLYLSHTLSLPTSSTISATNSLISDDIALFIRHSRLSGRTFLRLRDSDFEELGINVRWRAALGEARERLKKEAVAASEGGFTPWGFQGGEANAIKEKEQERGESRPQLRRRPSVDVEGSADEDEQVKEEWKRSWRTLGGKTPGRVRGLRDAFEAGRVEAVEEVSEPGSSPVKSWSRNSTMGKRSSWAEGWRSYAEGRHRRGDSTESAFSVASAPSVDSLDGRYEGLSASRFLAEDDLFGLSNGGRGGGASERRDQSLSQVSDRGLPFPFATPDPTPLKSRFSTDSGPARTATSDHGRVPRLELDLASAPTSPTPARDRILLPSVPSSTAEPSLASSPSPPQGYQSSISLHPAPYALVRRSSIDGSTSLQPGVSYLTSVGLKGKEGGILVRREGKGSGRVSFEAFARPPQAEEADAAFCKDEDEEDEDEGGEPTVRPARSGSGASAFSSEEAMRWPASPTTRERDPRIGGLAELFDLEVLKTQSAAAAAKDDGGEGGLATLFVPSRGEGQQRKGSLVLVKKSQLAALHRRLDEVESLVSSALTGSPVASVPSSPVVGEKERYYQETWRGGRTDGSNEGNGPERVELEGEIGRVEGLESCARLLASTTSSSPTSSCTSLTALSPAAVRPVPTSSSDRFPSTPHRRNPHPPSDDEAPDSGAAGIVWPEGWRQLSGYVVAASIGIGIVAGEVVLASVFGMRRR
ncbi:hypothetical protein JCM11251_006170 [Rhodosporidiobolus azoricus]